MSTPLGLRMPRISPSAAGAFLDCPRAFWHERVRKPRLPRRGGPWAHLSRGGSIHAALSLLMDDPPERRTPDRAVQLLAQVWQTGGYRDKKQNGDAFIAAADWVAQYVERPEVVAAVTRGNERDLSALYPAKEPVVRLEGRLDRIDEREPATPERPASLVVVDYKTGKQAPTQEDANASIQLALYVWLVMHGPLGRRAGRWCTRAELHHVPSGEVIAVEYDKERITRLLNRLVDLVREIERARKTAEEAAATLPKDEAEAVALATFPARPSGLCASCSFLDYCDEGKARARRAPGWAYLDDERVSQQ